MLSFRLSDEFIGQYEGKGVPWGNTDAGGNSVGELIFIRTYSRVKEDGTKETWSEVCRRVIEGMYSIQKDHCKSNKLPWNDRKAQASAQEAFDRMFNLKWSPPGRGLWVTGTPAVHERGLTSALYNCFVGETKVLTSDGVRRLDEISGEKVEAWTPSGWVSATAASFGIQPTQRVTFKPFSDRTNHRITVDVTPNHRWILEDGTETTSLAVGDKVFSNVASPGKGEDYENGVRHGIIFGDGSRHAFVRSDGAKRFGVRLCGARAEEMASYFEHITFPESANGDGYAHYLSHDELKEFPAGKSNDYIAGFVDGWLLADGNQLESGSPKLDSQFVGAYEWLVDHAAIAGYVVTGIHYSSKPTNFGERSNPLARITLSRAKTFSVVAIDELDEQEVYCLVVPETGNFTLANGLLTGNCSFISTDDMTRNDPGAIFGWVADALMCGIGVGFDTRGASKEIIIRKPDDDVETTYVIPDTREGWAESVRLLINSILRTDGRKVNFDYSLVRPAGEPIRGFGGTSSGAGPLIKLHDDILRVVGSRVGEVFDSRAIVDVVNLIGTCVVAGNVRRSATIALGSGEDQTFVHLKDYEKFPERAAWGWMSNNTISVEKGDVTDYEGAAQRIVDNGEPGFLWNEISQQYGRLVDAPNGKDHRAKGTNPCAEITLESYELCNLVEIHLNNIEDRDDLLRTLKFAYLYAKSITLLPTHWPETNAVIQRNRRIGTSMTGISQFADIHGLPVLREWFNDGYEFVQKLDSRYSEWLGIRESIKTTTVKPSGTVSLLSGASPGVHWTPGGQYFLRAVRFSASEPIVNELRSAGYTVEDDLVSANTVVAYFPIKSENVRSEKDVTIFEKIALAAETQRYWADNSVSVTVSFDAKTEAEHIPTVLKMYEGKLKTVSFLPMANDVYPQQPYTQISEEQYNSYVGKIGAVSTESLYLNGQEPEGDRYCTTDVCTI